MTQEQDGYTLATIQDFVGRDFGTSAWVTVGQERINAFADCTEDRQWIHVDEERAQASPLGSTIAHGFLTLSLLPLTTYELGLVPDGVAHAMNYGMDKVRFLHPVVSGSRVRNHVRLVSAVEKSGGRILLKTENTIEIEGVEKPAMVAEALTMLFPA